MLFEFKSIIWELFNFTDDQRSDLLTNFLEEFKKEKNEDVEKLQILKHSTLRRMKEDDETKNKQP
jgi:predicted PolB exonuclease-like 3'-5' exonuclease